jgi:hypothetical protein
MVAGFDAATGGALAAPAAASVQAARWSSAGAAVERALLTLAGAV